MPFDAETKVKLMHIDSDTKFGAVYYVRQSLKRRYICGRWSRTRGGLY